MTDAKFTPGPWTVELAGMRGIYRVMVPREHEARAAETDGEDGASVTRANAALIAAAPALYEAAKLALAEMVRTSAPRDSFTDAVDALDAAISHVVIQKETR